MKIAVPKKRVEYMQIAGLIKNKVIKHRLGQVNKLSLVRSLTFGQHINNHRELNPQAVDRDP